MTDRRSYNYSGQFIPPAALKIILKHPKLASKFGSEADVDVGRLLGMVVSERTGQLETLHIAICSNENQANVNVFRFADVFGTFNGVRMEDSGCIACDYLVYVPTKDDPFSALDCRL
ncbi:hypothetical protein PanWU01x14_010670 [Parasponia andersonii]|uniref:Uncharacterized protein n=1 Tax=Parasponia andersonii TaxID=3476 RepID=A0A2P5E2Q9_PARAD|nr:hypothetical protein PanWU01x14_010670 [Parasponia andersonii]